MGAQGSKRERYREPASLGRGGSGGGGFTAVVTGANTGLGKETAARLAASGATVVFACRSEQRARKAMEDVLARGGGVAADRVEFMPLDLASFKVRIHALHARVLLLEAGCCRSERRSKYASSPLSRVLSALIALSPAKSTSMCMGIYKRVKVACAYTLSASSRWAAS